jgi:hypothetical protein
MLRDDSGRCIITASGLANGPSENQMPRPAPLSNAIVEQLRTEAAAAGDEKTVADCDRILNDTKHTSRYDAALRRLHSVLDGAT